MVGFLQSGNYTCTVSITWPAAGISPQTIKVNLIVGQPQNLTLAPTSLAFSSQFTAFAPATSTVAIQ
jgi:hypothetical protein